jgi:hypothetical protein
MHHQHLEPKKTKYYATVDADLDLVALGGMDRPATELMAGTTGNIVITNFDGSIVTVEVPANVPIRGSFKAITDLGTTAAKLIVTWYG